MKFLIHAEIIVWGMHGNDPAHNKFNSINFKENISINWNSCLNHCIATTVKRQWVRYCRLKPTVSNFLFTYWCEFTTQHWQYGNDFDLLWSVWFSKINKCGYVWFDVFLMGHRHCSRFDVFVSVWNKHSWSYFSDAFHWHSGGQAWDCFTGSDSGIILDMRPAKERRRYIVTSSLIGWAHTQHDILQIVYVYDITVTS